MADYDRLSRPIQVFLDTNQFISLQQGRPRGGNRDFFEGNDRGFARHKTRIRQEIRDAAEGLRREGRRAGFVMVQMREEALAKSYRPLNVLFSTGNSFHVVGGGRIGEMFFQCTPSALESLGRRIDVRAELEPRVVQNEKTGRFERRVSAYRSELGGIEDVHLPAPSDRVAFSAREAIEWLGRPDILGGYIVELFRPDWTIEGEAVRAMVNRFRQLLTDVGGVVALPVNLRKDSELKTGHFAVSVDLLRDHDQSLVMLPLFNQTPTQLERQEAVQLLRNRDFSVDRHQNFLEQLAAEPMVRRVSLPPAIEAAPFERSEVTSTVKFPAPHSDSSPVVGIVDGGVADIRTLSRWCAGSTDPVAPQDRDLGHGTFIAGLVAGGRTLNPHIKDKLEVDGCRFYDIPLLPRKGLLTQYYQTYSEFFDQLEEEILRAKSHSGVRVFNLSLGVPGMRRGLGYSVFANALDEIALEHDVIFVVSAGNLDGRGARAPWPVDGDNAVRMLAGGSTADDRLIAPAEHLRGLTVGAVNPPGIPGHNADLPTTYTRRGPGAGGARKPELCHYGGVARRGGNRTGLFSIAPDRSVVDSSGTSFAAPLVATTVATVDHILEGMVPRETLIALMVHRAERCHAMEHKALRHVAREFVGFGMAPVTDVCLSDSQHSVTLVFSETLLARRELDFVFSWPRSLVNRGGKCRGEVDLTLAFTPPIDAEFDAESLRVQLEAYLYQIETSPETGGDDPKSRLRRHDSELPQGLEYTERYLLKTGLKWTPVKRYTVSMPSGRGTSSDWRLSVRASMRAGAPYPESGVPFTLIMTISDPEQAAPIYDEVRNEIVRRGLALADITVAHRVRPRS